MTVENTMNLVARVLLLLAALLALSAPMPAAAWGISELPQAGVLFGSLQTLMVDLDTLRAGGGRRVAAPISSTLALLGMGLLALLMVLISRRRR
jgi:hypothetical protein